jgi:phage terminase small subunit
VALTGKQAAFVEAYLNHRNATRAAREAGYDGDYNSLAVIGHENLKKVNIAEAISARITESCMSADEVLERLGQEARSDQADFWDIPEDGGLPVLNLARAKQEGKTHLIKKIKVKTTTRTITKGDESTEIVTVETDLDLYDAQAAKALIGRHHKLFTDKTEISGPDGGPISFTADAMAQAASELDQWKQRKTE